MNITDTSYTWMRTLCLFARQLYERLQVRLTPQHRIIRIGAQLDEAGVIGGFVVVEGEFTVQADTLPAYQSMSWPASAFVYLT